MRLVDANVLLYAVNSASAQNRVARRWLDTALTGREAVGFAWIVLLAYLRLATHRAVFQHPLTVGQAKESVRGWLAQPAAVVVEPTARHVDVLAGLLAETGHGRQPGERRAPRRPGGGARCPARLVRR